MTLRSVLGPRSTNELKLQHLYTLEKSMPGSELPADNIPRAIVQRVESEIDGKTATTTIQLGGQRYSPENFYNHVLQLVDNYYYNTNKVNYTYGFDLSTRILILVTVVRPTGVFILPDWIISRH